MLKRLTLGLTAPQIACVVAMFVLTLTGAILLAWWFRRRNLSHPCDKTKD